MADESVTKAPEKKGFFDKLGGLAVPAAVGAGVGAIAFGVPLLAGAVIGAGATAVGRAVANAMKPKSEPTTEEKK